MEPAKKRRCIRRRSVFLDAPSEIIYIISSFLNASDVIKLKGVHPQVLKMPLPLNYCGLLDTKCSIESFIDHAKYIKKIYMYKRTLPIGFVEILRKFRNISQLHIRQCNADVIFKSSNLNFLHNLEVLGLWDSDLKDGDYKRIASFKKLKYLDLTGTSIKNGELKYLIENLPNLRQICLIQCIFIRPAAFNIRKYSNIEQICVPFSLHASVKEYRSYASKYPRLTEKKCQIDHARHAFNLI